MLAGINPDDIIEDEESKSDEYYDRLFAQQSQGSSQEHSYALNNSFEQPHYLSSDDRFESIDESPESSNGLTTDESISDDEAQNPIPNDEQDPENH